MRGSSDLYDYEQEVKKMNLKKFYEVNDDFKGYVDRYCKQSGKTIEQALEIAIVKEYALYLIDMNPELKNSI